eukprot:8803439-Karenia_brevis.AAC.1
MDMIREAYDESATELLEGIGLVNENNQAGKISKPKAMQIGDVCDVEFTEIDSAMPTLAVAEQHKPHDTSYMLQEALDELARELKAEMFSVRSRFEAVLRANNGS